MKIVPWDEIMKTSEQVKQQAKSTGFKVYGPPVSLKAQPEEGTLRKILRTGVKIGAGLRSGVVSEQQRRAKGESLWSWEGLKKSHEAFELGYNNPEYAPTGEDILVGWGWKEHPGPQLPVIGTPRNIAGALLEANTDPINAAIGMATGGLAGKALPKAASMVGRVGRSITQGAVEGGSATAADAYAKGQPVASALLIGATGGAVLRGGGEALSPVAGKIRTGLAKALSPLAGKIKTSLAKGKIEPMQPPTIEPLPRKTFGILRPKNTALESAINRYNEAVQTIQNHFGTNQLRTDEVARIKTELGIDLDSLINDIEKAEAGVNLRGMGERGRLERVVGLAETPKLEKRPIKPLEPLPIQNTNINSPLPKSATEQPKGINMANWKDKWKPLLKRETMERNIEDIAGKDAPEVIKTYFEPVHKSESDRIRWLNKERKEIADLGIKGKSKESELVQKYGEGQYTVEKSGEFRTHKYTLDDLKRDAPKNWQKIKRAAEIIRQKYDRYLDEINTVLQRNGYDPIPKRKDYMAHFQEIGDLLERFGVPVKDNALPTDINGLTAGFKPGKNFFANALQRKGKMTTLDAIQGIDRYLEGASKLIYHTDNIQRLRQFEKSIREQFAGTDHLANLAAELTEYTNNLAGKKALTDRAAEDVVGRKIYGAVDRLKKQVSSNIIGMNIGSSLTNFIPLTQSMATTNKKAFVQGMLETIVNVFKNDGFIDKSDFLTRRIGSDRLVMNLWDNAANKGFWLFKIIDNWISQVIVRSKYLEGIKNGLSPAEAMKNADDWAARMIADRSLGSMPTLFNSKTLSIFTQFQLEVNNQLSFMFKDIPRNFSKVGAASAIAQLLIYGYLFNTLYEKAVGRRPAFDPIWVSQKAYEDYTNPDKSKTEATMNLVRNTIDQLPFVGLFTGGRIPLGSALPNVPAIIQSDKPLETAKSELKKSATNLLLPTGGTQLRKTSEGYDIIKNKGAYNKDKSQLMYPVKSSKANTARALLFGKSSLPEAREYYEKNRRPLGENQTKAYQRSSNPEEYYDMIMKIRELQKKRKRGG